MRGRREKRQCNDFVRVWERNSRRVSRQHMRERVQERAVRCLRGCKARGLLLQAFRSLTHLLVFQRQVDKKFKTDDLALETRENRRLSEVVALRRELQEGQLAREHTENELFHTQEALAKSMVNSRKIDEHRQHADEEMRCQLEVYRLQTLHLQSHYANAVQRLEISLDRALKENEAAAQDTARANVVQHSGA